MPIYEYECEECQEVVEAMQSFSDEPLSDCPACSGSLRKLISRSSFHLKGSGWYSDGYNGCSNSKSEAGKSDSKAATPPPSCPKKSECGGCPATAS